MDLVVYKAVQIENLTFIININWKFIIHCIYCTVNSILPSLFQPSILVSSLYLLHFVEP